MKERKYKIKPQIIIALVVAVIAIVALIAGSIISSDSKNKENTVGMTLTQKNLRPQDALDNNNDAKEITTVEILMDDTAVPVGTTFMAAAIVQPSDTDKALVWSSSNQDVMTVGQDGLVTITGAGTAALTATVGDVSDAVAIEGITSVAAGSKNGYTVYTGNGNITRPASSSGTAASSGNVSGSSVVTAGNNSSGSYSSGGSGYNSGGIQNSNGSAANTSSASGSSSAASSDNNSGNESGYNTPSSDNGSNNSGNSGNNSYNNSDNQGSGNSGSSDGKTSSDIADVLDGQGFTQEYSNVYVYTEDGTYYGEIITQPNVSIIYIKQRNGGFDSRIKSVLSELLPDSYNQVWNNYVSATSDRTFTVEGRKVRIVTASRGGHSQIVIYN